MPQQSQQSYELAELAEKALSIYRKENPKEFAELIEAFEGRSADLALVGRGRLNVSVSKGEVRIQPDVMRGSTSTGRGATTPETLLEIMEGRLAPLEAFFKGDIMASADSLELHRAYGFFAKFADSAMRSEQLQELTRQFRQEFC